MTNIAFIGGGNMARALAGGLIAAGAASGDLIIADPSEEQRQHAAALGPVRATADNREAVAGADVVVLAVKPQHVSSVANQIGAAVAVRKPLVVSIAAGIVSDQLARWLGGYRRLVRAMPNTPALVGRGATGLYAIPGLSHEDRKVAEKIVAAVGVWEWVDKESGLDTITALSGSGPAYFFMMMAALENAACRHGLDESTAARLCRETAAGAAAMALSSDVDLTELRRRVTSPGGTTEAAIAALVEGRFEEALSAAVNAARARSIELSRQHDTN